MMSSTHDLAKSIFLSALDISSEEQRRVYLDTRCGNDSALRGEVEELLSHQRDLGGFLDEPDNNAEPTIAFELSSSESSGAEIGPYKLLEQIGEGGFGVVFLAEQTRPIRREVALKVVKAGMDTKEVLARFEAEQQALALMEHPNIAKALDGGRTDSGRPYFVMELVPGIPITEYCDQCRLTTQERLRLYLSVCQAVQHAHQKGVIHRDLKPSNILVSMQDGGPTPKIIDFGVAKAINQRLTENTLRTRFAQFLGTPLYMSPEQAELSQLGVDTRSDIYSLGVLLYELLTGITPFDKDRLQSVSFDELRQIIQEEEPPRPSTRLSTLAGDVAQTVADRHRTEVRHLTQTVRGDLDWIVMKAMEKDRTRRYATANGLARDVERYLNDEPVEACPPSTAYRMRKFARRNKVLLASVTAVVASLFIGLVGTIWQAIERGKALDRAIAAESDALTQATLAKKRAEEAVAERDKAQSVVHLLENMLSLTQNKPRNYTLEELLDEYSSELEGTNAGLGKQPEVAMALHQIMGMTYHHLGLYEKAQGHLDRSLSLHRRVFGEDHVAYADAKFAVAQNLWITPWSDRRQTEQVFQDSLATYQKLGMHEHELDARFWLMMNNLSQSRIEEAVQVAEEALQLAVDYRLNELPIITHFLQNLSVSKNTLGEVDIAIQLSNQAIDRCARLHHNESNLLGWCQFHRGIVFRDSGNLIEAEECFRKSLACFREAHVSYVPRSEGRSLVELREIFTKKGDTAALEELNQSYSSETLFQSLGISSHAELLWFRNAESALRRVREIADLGYGGSAADELAWWAATDTYSPYRDSGEGVQLAELAVRAEPGVADYWTTLGVARYQADKIEQALEALNKAVELRGHANGRDGFFLAMAHQKLGESEAARRWFDMAIDWMKDNESHDVQLKHFRAEAAAQLGEVAVVQ